MKPRFVFEWFAPLSLLAIAACSPPVSNDAGADSSADVTVPDVTVTDVTVTDVTANEAATPADSAVTDAMVTDASAPTDGGSAACPLTRVVVTTTDGVEGAYVTGTVADRMLQYVPPPAGRSVEQDHVVRRAGCRVYALVRSFGAGPNQLIELDPANPFTPRRTITVPPVAMVGAPNPYDLVEVSPTKSYLVLYNSAQLYVFNPQTGAMTGSVDLRAFADSDGIPEASMIHFAGGRAWIALQQLDRGMGYAPPARSTVVAIDTATDQPADLDAMTAGVQSTVQLTYGNPQSSTVASDGRHWLIASSGTFGNRADGGIDVLDTVTGRIVATFSAAMLGGGPGSLTMVAPTRAWVATRVASDAGSSTVVREIELTGMLVNATPALTRPQALSDLQRGPDGNVWALDGQFGGGGGVYVFSTAGMPVSTFTLPPRGDAGSSGTYSLAFAP
jgi:hypothetical protein